jgi:hypothetical protein
MSAYSVIPVNVGMPLSFSGLSGLQRDSRFGGGDELGYGMRDELRGSS